MARPRKNDSNELIRLVDEFFSTEACGNPSKLKGSRLESFAARHGSTAKSYDFRRDPAVMAHISQLKNNTVNGNLTRLINSKSYKTLDTSAIKKKYHDPEKLIKALSELDSYWKSIYEYSCNTDSSYQKCSHELMSCKEELTKRESCITDLTSRNKDLVSENNSLIKENRYLKSMLRTYLYPALANKILQEDHVSKDDSGFLAKAAEAVLMDGRIPRSVSESIAPDRSLCAHEEMLLEKMENLVDAKTNEQETYN